MAEKKTKLLLAKTRYGEDIWLAARKPWRCVLQGVSGSGKTVLLQVLLCEIARCGADHQVLIINPKIVGFAPFEKRFDVLKDHRAFAPALQKAYDLMMMRYREMDYKGWDEYPIDDDHPLLYIVIDEIAEMLTGTNRERQQMMTLLMELASLSRQAGMCMILAGQTINADVLSTQVRNNLDFQLALRSNSAVQTSLVVPDGFETEAPAHQLPGGRAGFGYFRVSSTNGHFVLGKALYAKPETIARVCARYEGDHRKVDWIPSKEEMSDD